MKCRLAFLPFPLLFLSLGSVLSQSLPAERVPISASVVHDVLIDSGWEFQAVDARDHPESSNWRPAKVPGVVLMDLLAAKVIPDASAIETDWSYPGGRTLVTLRSSRLARNVWIGFEDLDIQLSDNSFDLLPNIPVTVEIKGSSSRDQLERSLQVTSLRDAFGRAAFSAFNSKNLPWEAAS